MDLVSWLWPLFQMALVMTLMIGLVAWRILRILTEQRAAELRLRDRLARTYAVKTPPAR